jgi:hypothetical protein
MVEDCGGLWLLMEVLGLKGCRGLEGLKGNNRCLLTIQSPSAPAYLPELQALYPLLLHTYAYRPYTYINYPYLWYYSHLLGTFKAYRESHISLLISNMHNMHRCKGMFLVYKHINLSSCAY